MYSNYTHTHIQYCIRVHRLGGNSHGSREGGGGVVEGIAFRSRSVGLTLGVENEKIFLCVSFKFSEEKKTKLKIIKLIEIAVISALNY